MIQLTMSMCSSVSSVKDIIDVSIKLKSDILDGFDVLVNPQIPDIPAWESHIVDRRIRTS